VARRPCLPAPLTIPAPAERQRSSTDDLPSDGKAKTVVCWPVDRSGVAQTEGPGTVAQVNSE